MKDLAVTLSILIAFLFGTMNSSLGNQAGFPDEARYKSDVLSKDYLIFKEWTGGGSCCLVFHVFQTKPTFKKLLEHNNDFFDATEIVIGPHQLELHRYKEHLQPSSIQPHVNLRYNPSIYDLKQNRWSRNRTTDYVLYHYTTVFNDERPTYLAE